MRDSAPRSARLSAHLLERARGLLAQCLNACTERGKALYGRRIATVEPVFANLRYNKRLDRFTLRTQRKVNTQWHLYCLVHNIEKLARHGYRAARSVAR